ncbi:hypothetical protein FBY39_2447 [Microbacterium sp. SLBN-146]|nr:hypothetical protein FBY39_2447 [Microbacterium sp. SLBN-146]
MTESEQVYVNALLLEISTLREMLMNVDLEVLARMRARQASSDGSLPLRSWASSQET